VATIPQSMMIQVLAMLDASPAHSPDRFDRLQRELDAWWNCGGSCRRFVEDRGGVWRVLCRTARS
jgi:hypothetical protein